MTHAQPLVGIERGTYKEELGSKSRLRPQPSTQVRGHRGAVRRRNRRDIRRSEPTINGYVQSGGKDLRIIAGATSAGATARHAGAANINTPADFANKKVATPQLGNTQDVALRAWLQANGLKDKDHGGNVQVIPTANADTLTLFQRGDIDAAWVPEPWATRLVQEAGGKIFLNESTLWPNGDFVTTQLVVRTKFLKRPPGSHRASADCAREDDAVDQRQSEEAKKLVNQGIKKATNAALPDAVIQRCVAEPEGDVRPDRLEPAQVGR